MGIFQNKIKKYIAYKQQRKATGCVYTCLTDNYDNLPNHSYFDVDLDYICFTDDVSAAKTMRDSIWEFRPLIYSASDSVRNSRYHKLHPHEFLQDYEYSIWVDSNIDIRTPHLFKLIDKKSDKKLLMPIHYERDCIYDEIAEVINLKLDNYNTVLKQREFLLNNKMPEHYGLNETNIVYRKHHDAADVVKMMSQWWFIIENFSKRDQLSCSYVLFKNNIKIEDISFANARKDKNNFKIKRHNKSLLQIFSSIKSKVYRKVIVNFGMRLLLNRAANKMRRSIDKNIKNFSSMGINENKRSPGIIVSLASIPERITEVKFALYSLLTQTLKPDRVILWLASHEFPDGMNSLPKSLLDLQKNGLEIKWCRNATSYNKLIPALQEFPGDIIVTADDDLWYPDHWLELLYKSYLKNSDCAHAHRIHRIKLDHSGNILQYKNWDHCFKGRVPSFLNFPTTGAGALFPPDIFYKDILKNDLYAELCPYADDIWVWAMLTLSNKKTILVDSNISNLTYINPDRELGLNSQMTLGKLNVHKGYNDMQFHNIILHYFILKDYLTGELNVPAKSKP